MANFATEIISGMKQRMLKTSEAIDDTLVGIICTKAVVNAIVRMAEDEHQIEIANALYGVSGMLDAISGRLNKRYRKDCKYLSSIGCENDIGSD